ncbi:erythromycin esterase family protein [Streptomyces sp. TRM 70361]|uniref:erythromycin esterase family protein n=1 Tax=Streptomyces sp. TRM 70361 TaxID=3116553 RepID=UPI002E7BE339|nr:erythromycin esterase family protein [Streptomyces sp. TRM 70361]MEE1939380.1 erythromycin esterase family protein [Streptomyces sp. TRM 70361]
MTSRRKPILALTATIILGTLATAVPVHQAIATPHKPHTVSVQQTAFHKDRLVLHALERSARPLRSTEPYGSLRDLRALGRMIGDAEVVGMGEATHGSHEFFTVKHRVFRYLVQEKGFRTFSLEGPWSTGLKLNDYVLHGKGDLKQILDEEYQGVYKVGKKSEYRDILQWMRDHNRRHPHDPVQFMGNDMGYAGPELYDRVADYVAKAHPRRAKQVNELYDGLRPTVPSGDYMDQYLAVPLAERQDNARRTGKVLALLEKAGPASGRKADRQAHTWAVQHARAIDQSIRGYSFDVTDLEEIRKMMTFRDKVMADNVAWWNRHTGDKVMVSAHNTHVAYDSYDENYPKVQGAFLRDHFGKRYVSVGFSFDRGSFRAFDAEQGSGSPEQTFRVGASKPGSNEHLLDQVRYRDYLVDMRTAPAPARAWLAEPRATRNIGAAWPVPEQDLALGGSHDVLIHLHEVTAATPLD